MPSLGMLARNTLAASDEVLIPVEASYLPIKGLQQLLKTIGKVRRQINPKLQIAGILFNLVDAHTNDARNNMEMLHHAYGSQIHVFENFIPFSMRKNATPISLQSLDELFGTMDEEQTGIQQIALDNLHPFSGHPFKVLDDDKMMELAESVRTHDVLLPGIVRIKDSGGYEIIAGHRRKRTCEIAGLKTMPVIIKDLTDDESTVIMVDSNIQREELLVSEKACAYKMKYEAWRRTPSVKTQKTAHGRSSDISI